MSKVRFFPHENFSLKSKFDPDVVQAKLQLEVTFNDKGFDKNADQFFDRDTQFLGFAGKHRFNIKPYVNYNEFLLPQLQGTIEPDNGGSIIGVKMALPATTKVVLAVFMSLVGLACLAVVVWALRFIAYKGVQEYLNYFNAIMLIPFVVFILGYVLITSAFKVEGRKAKNTLVQLFEGEIQ